MALANAVQGAKRPSQLITWSDEDGTAVDLTGATITARIEDMSGTVRASDSTFTLTTPASGVFRWDYSTADVATAGVYVVQFTATYVAPPTPGRTISAIWEVLRAI